jgi:hypothetical protein
MKLFTAKIWRKRGRWKKKKKMAPHRLRSIRMGWHSGSES